MFSPTAIQLLLHFRLDAASEPSPPDTVFAGLDVEVPSGSTVAPLGISIRVLEVVAVAPEGRERSPVAQRGELVIDVVHDGGRQHLRVDMEAEQSLVRIIASEGNLAAVRAD